MLQFKFEKLPENLGNEKELKRVFKNLHVIDVDTQMNNITGETLGQGSLKVRVSHGNNHELQKALKGLKDMGAKVEKGQAPVCGRKR